MVSPFKSVCRRVGPLSMRAIPLNLRNTSLPALEIPLSRLRFGERLEIYIKE